MLDSSKTPSKVTDLLEGGDLSLLVCGTLHPRPSDRQLNRSQVKAVQVLVDGRWCPCPDLAALGTIGMYSIIRLPNGLGWLATTGSDLIRYDPETGVMVTLDVPGLDDVHDLCVVDGTVLLANTGADEIIEVSLDSWRVSERQPIRRGRIPLTRFVPEVPTGTLVQAHDKFHLNQIFVGLDGEVWGTVHNVDGRQVLLHKMGEIIKAHGNGGVVNLHTGHVHELRLSSPHSIRTVGDRYVVFDSGAAMVQVFSADWHLEGRFPTLGWGRGVDISPDGRWLVAGMSPIRKRYANRVPMVSRTFTSAVEVFDTTNFERMGRLEVPHVEEIYSVTLISATEAKQFADPEPGRPADREPPPQIALTGHSNGAFGLDFCTTRSRGEPPTPG